VVAGRLIAAQILALTALAILPSPASSHPHDPQDSTATAAVDSAEAVPQRDFGDLARVILRRPVRTDVVEELRPGLSLTVLPSVGYNAAYGAYAGASVSLGGWLGNPTTTSLSSGAAGATYSTEGQLSIQFRSDFYLPDDQWALKLDWRYLDTSQPTYGLGPSHPDRPEYPMDFVLYRSYQTLYKRVSSSPVYFGIGYHFDRYDEIHDERAELGEITPYVAYSGGAPTRAQLSALSANVLVDTRDRAIDARRGMFWNASLRSYMEGLGSDENSQSLWSDFRSFKQIPWKSRPNVLAIWSYLWFTFGNAPYLDLPAIGWDTYGRSGRGYVQGELRGTNQVYVEAEYRMRFTDDGLWGGVVFANASGTTSVPGGTFERLDPGGGAGLRLKFNKRTSTNLAADVAVGRSRTSRIFLGLQETF
jgi:outer membrane protein assembly factor BamA